MYSVSSMLAVADPDVVGPLAVFPLITTQPPALRYQAFAQAVAHGACVRELPGEASVNDLQVANPLDVPVLLAQGDRDTTIPAATTKILATRMCASGDEVETLNKPDAGHSEIVTAADAEIRDWLAARLAGEAATSNCSR